MTDDSTYNLFLIYLYQLNKIKYLNKKIKLTRLTWIHRYLTWQNNWKEEVQTEKYYEEYYPPHVMTNTDNCNIILFWLCYRKWGRDPRKAKGRQQIPMMFRETVDEDLDSWFCAQFDRNPFFIFHTKGIAFCKMDVSWRLKKTYLVNNLWAMLGAVKAEPTEYYNKYIIIFL